MWEDHFKHWPPLAQTIPQLLAAICVILINQNLPKNSERITVYDIIPWLERSIPDNSELEAEEKSFNNRVSALQQINKENEKDK